MYSGPRTWKPLDRARAHEIGDEDDVCLLCGGNLQDTDASDLKFAAQLGWGRRNEP